MGNNIGTELERTVIKARQELAAAEAKLADFQAMEPAKQLATTIHDKTCHMEHTETCGWFYENDWNQGWTKKRYLRQANKILEVVDFDEAMKVVALLNTYDLD